MHGLVIEKSKSGFFTHMDEVFDTLGDVGREYNWLISDLMCNRNSCDELKHGEPFAFLDGNDLYDFVYKEKHFQFIWAVLTAFKKDITPEQIAAYPLPFADGYTGFWQPEVTMQNPYGEIEIVSWDSTLLLVIAKDEAVIEKFRRAYPSAVDLAEYNAR